MKVPSVCLVSTDNGGVTGGETGEAGPTESKEDEE